MIDRNFGRAAIWCLDRIRLLLVWIDAYSPILQWRAAAHVRPPDGSPPQVIVFSARWWRGDLAEGAFVAKNRDPQNSVTRPTNDRWRIPHATRYADLTLNEGCVVIRKVENISDKSRSKDEENFPLFLS